MVAVEDGQKLGSGSLAVRMVKEVCEGMWRGLEVVVFWDGGSGRESLLKYVGARWGWCCLSRPG